MSKKPMSKEETDERNIIFQKVAQLNMQFESLEASVKQAMHQNLMKQKEECYNKHRKSAEDFANCSHSLIEQVRIRSSEMKFRINFFENKMEKCMQKNENVKELFSCVQSCEKVYLQILDQLQTEE